MTAMAALQTSSTLLAQLANPAARALALGAAAGLGLAAFRVKATSTRLFTWTAVLCAALAMPVLLWILPPVPIAAPPSLQSALNRLRDIQVLGGSNQTFVATEDQSSLVEKNRAVESSSLVAAERRQNAAHGASRGNLSTETNQPQRDERSTLTHTSASSPQIKTPPTNALPISLLSISWTVLASAIYLAVALILLARFFVGLAYGRRLIRASQPIDDSLVTRKLVSATPPRLAEPELHSVPATMGAFRSEEHTSELQSLRHLVCRLLLEKKNINSFYSNQLFYIYLVYFCSHIYLHF